MKKIIIASLLWLISMSAFAAYEYKTYIGDITVTNLSGDGKYKYQLNITQKGVSGSSTYTSEATIILLPKTESLAGTFRLDDGTVDSESNVYYNGATRNVVDYTGKPTELVITGNADGTYTLSGAFRTKNGSNYYYYYYDASDSRNTFDIYEGEPAVKNFTLNAVNISCEDHTASSGRILLDLNTEDADYLELCFLTDNFSIPAGEYIIDQSGKNGTIAATAGMGDIFPTYTYMASIWSYYFIRSGSVKVSYSADGKMMNVTGKVISAHGSEITVNATGNSPFGVEPLPEPETFTLNVSSVNAVFHDDIEKPFYELFITALNGDKDCNGYVKISTDEIAGTYDWHNISAFSYMVKDDNCLDTTSPAHSVRIESNGVKDQYLLNLTLVCEDKNTYVIKDFVFTCKGRKPYDAEEDSSKSFVGTFRSEPYVYDESQINSRIIFSFNAIDSVIDIAFAASSKDDITPARYPVNISMATGTVIASEGRLKIDGELVDTPSIYGDGGILDDVKPYYIIGGYVDVSFVGGEIAMQGQLTTSKGSAINLDALGANNFKDWHLPQNVMKGVLFGTETGYVLTYDALTEDDGKVTVCLTAKSGKPVSGFKPRISVGGAYVDMTRVGSGNEYIFTTSSSYKPGDEISFAVTLVYDGGETQAKNIKYVVE